MRFPARLGGGTLVSLVFVCCCCLVLQFVGVSRPLSMMEARPNSISLQFFFEFSSKFELCAAVALESCHAMPCPVMP